MLELKDIRALNIEVSARCNAACAFCSRKQMPRAYGHHLISAADFELIPDSFIRRLRWVAFGGNFGDLCTNPDLPAIVERITRINPRTALEGNTNGSLQDETWWASLGPHFRHGRLVFALDGLGDTHRRHRRGTDFHKIVRNIQAFAANGGQAYWKFIVFRHNEHQIDAAEKLAQRIGCAGFVAIASREFDARLRPPETVAFKIKPEVFSDYRDKLTEDQRQAVCKPIGNHSIYIAADGSVHPCCIAHLVHVTGDDERMRFIRPLVAAHCDRINFKTTPLAEIVSGAYFRQVIALSRNDPYCITRCNCYKKQIDKELNLRETTFR